MNLVFKHVRISNFMSFEDSELDLDENGYSLVRGVNNSLEDAASSNGSGKSSIWEAISWALTGETIRGCKNVTNSFGSDGALVELTFYADGDEYILTRTKDHSKLKSSLTFIVNGVDKSGKGIRESEKLLNQFLPDLSASLIGSVIILGQGLPQKFTNNTPSGRKEVLEKLSQSDFMIEDLKKRISNRISYFNDELRKFEDSNVSLKTKQVLLNNTCIEEQNKLTNVESKQELIDSINEVENQITNETSSLNQFVDEKEKILDKYSVQNELVSKLFEKYHEEEKVIVDSFSSTLANLLSQKSSLQSMILAKKSEINKKLSISDICPTCGQKLIGVHKPDVTQDKIELRELESKFAETSKTYEDQLALKESDLSKLKEKFDSNIKKEKEILVSTDLEIKNYSDKIEKSKRIINTLNLTKSKYETRLDFVSNKIDELKMNIDNLKNQLEKISSEILYNNNEITNINSHLSVLNKMNTYIKREFRGYLLINVINFLDIKSKLYCKDVFEHENISFSLDGNNVAITFNGKEYEQLSGGEKQKVDVIIQLAIRDMLCKYMNFSSNIFVFDEIFDNIDEVGSEKILTLLSTRLNDVSSIYIVTHHSSIQIPVDREIVVVKDAQGISRIE